MTVQFHVVHDVPPSTSMLEWTDNSRTATRGLLSEKYEHKLFVFNIRTENQRCFFSCIQLSLHTTPDYTPDHNQQRLFTSFSQFIGFYFFFFFFLVLQEHHLHCPATKTNKSYMPQNNSFGSSHNIV